MQGNTSGGEGGGLRAGGTLVLNGTQVLNNTSSGQGGGVFASNTLTASGVELLSNRASYGGGASASGAATLSNVTFQGNTCTAGGCFNPGLYAASHVTLSGVVTSTDDLDVAGNWTHNGVLNQTGSKVLMRGNAAQTIGGSQPVNFLSLDIRNASAAGMTLGSNITVTNQLNLVNDLTTTIAYRVNLPVAATTAGTGDVWGNTYRAHTFTTGTAYAYGNPNVSIKFDSGTPPTAMLVDLTKGTPSGFTTAVARTYTITPSGGSGYAATVRLHYKDAELNGNTEAVLSLFRNDGTRWLKVGKSASDTGANWLEQSGVSVFSPWAIGTFAPSSLLTITQPGNGSGTITSTPAGISCPTDCSELFSPGTVVTLTATPQTGSQFAGWSGGGCSGTGACVITSTDDATISATFTLNQYQFSVTPPATGSGVITSTPAGISCPSDCSEPFDFGTVVTLTATPATGWSFTGWTVDCTGAGPCVITVGQPATVTPTFTLNQYPFSVTPPASGSGVITSTPAGISCPGDCSEPFGHGTVVTLTATPNPGWTFTGWTGDCTGIGACVVTVNGAKAVTPTFSLEKGTITFVKKTEGGDGVFSFSSPQLGNFRLTTQKKTAQRTFANLTPGTYSASEIPTKGWDLTNATCSDGSNPASINLAPGEQVTCNFTNVKRGSITVVKNSTGGDAQFPFASQTLGGFDLTTVGGTAQRVFSNLVAGTYDLSENTPAGWTQTAATCSDGSSPVSVSVAAGEEVTCTFTNVKQGSLTVVKQATGSDATFAFVSTALGAFDLTTVNGTASRTFANLNAGVYDVSETVPAGWRLDRTTCSDGSTLPNVDVAAGEDVTCTFENLQLDTIVVIKLAVGGDDAFPFASQALGSFVMTTTAGTAVQAFSGLTPGVYDMAETPVAGWNAAEADPTCSNGDKASAVTLGTGETVVCLFVNYKPDTIVVEKRTIGGDGAFGFASNLPGAGSFSPSTVNGTASRAFNGLAPATYSISEAPQAGWAQTGASCSDGSDPSSINLAAGATVRCIFTDTKLSNITVVKTTTGGDGSFAFTGSLGSFSLSTAGGTAQRTFANLLPGSYRISETVPSGWSLTGAGCADGSNPGSITLAAGRDLTCTFANTKGGNLAVIVDTTDGNGSFGFTSTALGDFSIMTSGGTGQKSFANLAPGVYDLNEVVTSDWDLRAATCSNGSNPATVSVAAGEVATCTFENTKAPELLYLPIIANGRGASSSFIPLVLR